VSVFLFFVLATVLGVLSTLFWIPEDDLGRGYFQMHALVVLGLLALSSTVLLFHPLRPFGEQTELAPIVAVGSMVAAFGYYFATWRERWMAARSAAAAGCLVVGAALWLCGRELVQGPAPLPFRGALTDLSLASSALLLGWSLVAMLLGHWYLVAPRLPFRHLIVFCWVLVATVALRLVSVGATLLAAGGVEAMIEPHPLRLLVSFEGQGMFFWFRILWGLAIPLLLAILSLHCARQRSNQSATSPTPGMSWPG